jgi:hypothetical protein
MPSDRFALHVRRDYRATHRNLVVDIEPHPGERLRLVMGKPAARVSRNRLVYHTGDLVTVSGHRFWAVIEQEAANGEHVSIGICLPTPDEGRPALIFPNDREFAQFAAATPQFQWCPYAYRYLGTPHKQDPQIKEGGEWSATWEELQSRREG